MKAVIQRVKNASVRIEGRLAGQIGQGYLVLLGVGKEDTNKTVERIVRKMVNLRIFADENGKTNLSIRDVKGEILVVSQFTLYADVSHGNRPGFTNGAKPELAKELYEYFIACTKKEIPKVEQGVFGADMQVELINDGPFTIILE